MKKQAIPSEAGTPEWNQAVTSNLQLILGQVRGGRIAPLQAGATSDEIVAKINELLALLQ